MKSEWREASFSELCDITRGASPRPIHEWISTTGTPWVKISDATASQSRFITKTGEYIKNEARRYSVVVNAGDLIVSNSATPGIPKIMGIEACIHDGWLLLRNLRGLDKMFAYYLLLRDRPALVEQGNGSVFTNLKTEILKNHRVKIPPLAEQKRISGILGALDDKIELNRQMNVTLEQMARAMFKSWFVDFDPVHAKAAGRQPAGMDTATADLFPDSFEDSELGKTPMGWKVMTVGEAVECLGGATPSTAETKYWEGGIHHWTTPKDFSSLASPFLLDTERKLTDAGIAKISSGLLPAGTLLLSSRAPIGYIAIATIPVAINQGFIALKCNENASNFFMLNWCKANMAEIESRATGTTFPEISKLNFRPIRVCLPPKELMSAFTSKVSPMYGKVVANLRQSRNLSAIRDTLLPRLLNRDISTSTTS